MFRISIAIVIGPTPPGTGEIPRALAARAHYSGCMVVTTPSDLAVADVVRGVSMLRKFDVPILGVVENMATGDTIPIAQFFATDVHTKYAAYPFFGEGAPRDSSCA